MKRHSRAHKRRGPQRVRRILTIIAGRGSRTPGAGPYQHSRRRNRQLRRRGLGAIATVGLGVGLAVSGTNFPGTGGAVNASAPATSLHYAANGNVNAQGTYLPGSAGFNLADVSSSRGASALPTGVTGLAYLGTCGGATSSFRTTIRSFVGNAKLFGFYLMDEPDPRSCPAANLKAESDWIHANDPGAKTFIVVQNMSAAKSPTYLGGYTPANSDVDLYGVDPYPCRTELKGCDYSYITKGVAAAESSGIPRQDIVPVYEAFGGGSWADDGGGHYQLPTGAQEQQIFSTWASVVPTPAFDYAYSWGSQNGDQSLATSTALQTVFAAHNSGATTPPTTTTTLQSTTVPSTTSTTAATTTTGPGATTTSTTTTPGATTSTTTFLPTSVAFVQAQSKETGSLSPSIQLSFSSVPAGATLVGYFLQYNSSGPVQVADKLNGAWTRSIAQPFSGTVGDVALYYVLHAKPGATTVTVSAAQPTYLQATVNEYTGIGSLDAAAEGAGSGNAPSTASTIPVGAGDVLFGAVQTGGTPGAMTAGASDGVPFTVRTQSGAVGSEDLLSTAAGTQTGLMSLANSTNWFAVVAAFKPSA